MKGEYHERELSEIKKRYLDTFFRKITHDEKDFEHEHIYRLSNEIRSMVKLAGEDLIIRFKSKRTMSDAYNLVLCRNVLIYMNRDLQKEIFQNLSKVIYKNGYLILGETETIPEALKNDFIQISPWVKIFKKKMASE